MKPPLPGIAVRERLYTEVAHAVYLVCQRSADDASPRVWWSSSAVVKARADVGSPPRPTQLLVKPPKDARLLQCAAANP